MIEALFKDCDDIVKKEFCLDREEHAITVYMVYIDGLTDGDMVQEHVIEPLLQYHPKGGEDIFQTLFHSEIDMVDLIEQPSFDQTVNSILRGDTALFVQGYETTIVISSKKLPVRSIQESETEAVMREPVRL